MAEKSDFSQTVQLLDQYKAGDQQALDDLYGRYFDRLLAVVRMRLGPALRVKMESVDIVQDAFLASLRGLDDVSCSGEGDFFHWLCKIAENRIRDNVDHVFAAKRDMARERALEPAQPSGQSVFGPLQELARHTASPASKVVRQEDVANLEAAIDHLPDDQKEALILVRYEGLSHAEAGKKLDRSPDAVRMLVARAIVALSKALSAHKPLE